MYLAKKNAYQAYPFQEKERIAYEEGFMAAWKVLHSITDMEAKRLWVNYMTQVEWSYRHKCDVASAGVGWMKKHCVRLAGEPESLPLGEGYLARSDDDGTLRLFVVNECGRTPGEPCREYSCESMGVPDLFPDIGDDDIIPIDLYSRIHEEQNQNTVQL